MRWVASTNGLITDRDKLKCLYGDRRNVSMTGIAINDLEAGCDVTANQLIVFVPTIVAVVLVSIMTWLVRYHRWYIKYHLTRCWKVEGVATRMTRRTGVTPWCCISCTLPTLATSGENLALGVHASTASSRERLGFVSLRWRSRRYYRCLENAQLRSRFPEQRQGSRVFDARVHRRQRLHELPGDGARQQQAAVQVHLCLIRRHPTYFRSPSSETTPAA